MGTIGSFNLLYRPWIPVRYGTGEAETVDLIALLEDAHLIRRVEGDLPTQTFAVLRLILAVLYTYAEKAGLGEWTELWRWLTEDPTADRSVPELLVDELVKDEDAFDLFHPERPFLQVAGLRSGSIARLNRIIADVPVGEQFFSTRAGPSADRLTPAEAARWLVHCHAYDTAGIKSGAVDDPLAKGGKGYGSKIGPCGALGAIYVEGGNLAETLLLNLVPAADLSTTGDPDLPAWLGEPRTGAYTVDRRDPAGPRELLTWQSRRIRLVTEGEWVTGVVLCNGDVLPPRNLHGIEPFSGWRRNASLSEREKHPVHTPIRHDPARAFWRGFEALLPKDLADDRLLLPRVLLWGEKLVRHKKVRVEKYLRVHAVGVLYGTQNAVYADIWADELVIKAGMLLETAMAAGPGEDTTFIRRHLRESVQKAEDAVTALGELAGNLARAAGADALAAARENDARVRAFTDLESRFRPWLRDFPLDEDGAGDAALKWEREVARVVGAQARALVQAAGGKAWAGRAGMDAPLAERRFHRRLRQALPLTEPRRPPMPPSASRETRAELAVYVGARVASRQRDYRKGVPLAAAQLARLRRSLNKEPGEIFDVATETATDPGIFGPPANEEPTPEEWAVHLAMCLHAHHQQSVTEASMHEQGVGFGAAVGALMKKDGHHAEAIGKRFHATGTASGLTELAVHMRGLIGRMRQHRVPLDYGRLAADLFSWQTPAEVSGVRMTWSRELHLARESRERE